MSRILPPLGKVACICVRELLDGMRNHVAADCRLGRVGIRQGLHELQCPGLVSQRSMVWPTKLHPHAFVCPVEMKAAYVEAPYELLSLLRCRPYAHFCRTKNESFCIQFSLPLLSVGLKRVFFVWMFLLFASGRARVGVVRLSLLI